jgi:Domain of unknown function (DUF1937)
MSIEPDEKLWYLATPYSKFEWGIEAAAAKAARVTGALMREGWNVYSPIVHSHYIAMLCGLDPLDHDFWMETDKAFMQRCDGLIVAMMQGWTKSKGVRMEIDAFKKAGKPMRYWDPEVNVFVNELLN